MSPEVTIIIPSLLRESLSKLIDSICYQEVPCSILVINGDNVSKQRNEGVAKTATPYILFTDDDTVLRRGTLKKMLEHKEDVVFGGVRGGFNTTPDQPISGANIFCNTEIARTIPWDETIRVGEDLDWGWRVMERKYNWTYDHEAVIFHIGRPQSQNTWGREHTLSSGIILENKHPLKTIQLRVQEAMIGDEFLKRMR